jgi:hypothetical protein
MFCSALCSSAAPPPAVLGRPSPPPAVLHLHTLIPSPSAALTPLFWPPTSLTRPSPLLPELPPPVFPPLPSPSFSYRELLWFKPFPFRSFFPLPCTHRTPNTTGASSLNSGALLLTVDSPPQSIPHHYNPLGSFPSPHLCSQATLRGRTTTRPTSPSIPSPPVSSYRRRALTSVSDPGPRDCVHSIV